MLDLDDPNSLGVNDVYPVATEWPTDPDEIPLRVRVLLCVAAVAGLAAAVALAYVWLPAAFIVGALIGVVFALRVKLDIRPQWPM